MIRVLLTSTGRYPAGLVLDSNGNVIGDANSYTYQGRAFAVHTKDYAGFYPFSDVEFIGGSL